MHHNIEQKLKALGSFKDWSNYLLVTTVAALGWATSKGNRIDSDLVVWCFAISAVFGILTLAVIPVVAEEIREDTKSIYDVEATFRLFWMWGDELRTSLKWVCWPQHVSFIIGILAYAAKHS
jgi:hypothetical protein